MAAPTAAAGEHLATLLEGFTAARPAGMIRAVAGQGGGRYIARTVTAGPAADSRPAASTATTV